MGQKNHRGDDENVYAIPQNPVWLESISFCLLFYPDPSGFLDFNKIVQSEFS
jgi:hypothetical protein